jgi:adenylate cyclase, class 2
VAIETEKKYRLKPKELAKITKRLKKLGAVFEQETFEENYLHRGRMLDARGAVLRLRKTDAKTLLTYKEALGNNGHVKQKIEFETEVSDVDQTEKIIAALGYRLSVVYEKRRKTYHLKNVEVVLDELPFGIYMEIEGTHSAIIAAEKLLGARKLRPEIRGYPRLTVKHGKMNGQVMEARFKKREATKQQSLFRQKTSVSRTRSAKN